MKRSAICNTGLAASVRLLFCITIVQMDIGPWENGHWRGVLNENALQYTASADDNVLARQAELLDTEQEVVPNAGEDGVDVPDEAIMRRVRKDMPKVCFYHEVG